MVSADQHSLLPTHQTALVAQEAGIMTIKHDVPVPTLAPDMVLVKTAAVAINPADAKMLDFSPIPGSIQGHDFAGTVVALGEDTIASGRFSLGDRVAGMVYGMNKQQPFIGAFAEYVGACADVLLRIPDDMSFTEASGLGLGVATAAMGLFEELRMPASLTSVGGPAEGRDAIHAVHEPEFVLVAGGSTATGTRAIQLAKLAGLRPIATCSPANFDLALRFGAEQVFDYHSPTCAEDIRAYTQNELGYSLDCVAQADTTKLCYEAMGRAGGRYVTLEPFRDKVAQTRPLTVEPSWFMVLSIFGGPVDLKGEYRRDADPKYREAGAKQFAAVQALMDRGLVEPHPVKSMRGGWDGILQGVDIIRKQPLSGQKLVYPVS
ncbi:hypothetical protein VSDG_03467 [Cytospora chrysosperma]|uniref:Enoyl reductase (ER) domain-containing protein n=1 Tax=Cytospora chrysosperma TaxID=252740 RepID=A0A423W9W9_CYTCH|nr:hypothetical protein VSDG_03467 [Valsa sordida]